jgi:hypothetical protein
MLTLALAALLAQDRTIDDFEGELSGWMALKLDAGTVDPDPDSKIATSSEGAKSGKASLTFGYAVNPGIVRVLVRQGPFDLAGMKSLRFWTKSSASTALVVSLTESSGASYQAPFSVNAGVWQEVVLNLEEFIPDEPGKDGNGKLDVDDIGSISFFDFGGFLALLVPDLAGSRTMSIDDLRFAAEPVARTTGAAGGHYLLDSFESPLIRWAPLSVEFGDALKINLFDAATAIDAQAPEKGGKASLRFTYPRKAAKAHGLLRSTEKLEIGKARALELWLKTSADGTYIVNLEEKDGSRYDKTVELKAADGWTKLDVPFSDFVLANDSQDENGKLDAADIKQVLVADATSLLGGSTSDEVRLWLDEVRFQLNP